MTRPPMNPCCVDPALDDAGLWLVGLTLPHLFSDLAAHECCDGPVAVLIARCDIRCNRATALYWLACFITLCQEKAHTYAADAGRPACLQQTQTICIAAIRPIVSSDPGGRNFRQRCEDLQAGSLAAHRLPLLSCYRSLPEDNRQFISNNRPAFQPRSFRRCTRNSAAASAPYAQRCRLASGHRKYRAPAGWNTVSNSNTDA